MYLKIGPHTFPLGQVALTITSDIDRNEADQPLTVRQRWTGQGLLTTQLSTNTAAAANIDSQIATLNSILTDGVDLILTMPNGTTHSQHKLLSASCVGGTRLISAGIPSFDRAGGITNLPFSFVYEGERLVSGAVSLLRSFEETIQFSGGGPRYGMIETQTGRPVKQLLRRNTIYRAVQSGTAVGFLAYPSMPPPIWLGAQMEQVDQTIKSPRRRLGDYQDFAISWNYRFESATPLRGNPTVWT